MQIYRGKYIERLDAGGGNLLDLKYHYICRKQKILNRFDILWELNKISWKHSIKKMKSSRFTRRRIGSATVDRSTGTMYFFLNKQKGWRLVVKDAAGSRFYGSGKNGGWRENMGND